MKNRLLFILILLLLLVLTGCRAKAADENDIQKSGAKEMYKVDYCGNKDWYTNAKNSYREGEEVTLYYEMIATDTNYSFLLDGESINYGYDSSKGFVISFIMPAHDVKLECISINTMTAYAPEAAFLRLSIDGIEIPVIWENNESVSALSQLVSGEGESLKVAMHMYGGFEQVGSLGQTIASSDEQITTSPGDIVLYSSDQIVVFYGSNSWAYTRLGRLDYPADKLSELLGNGDVTLSLSIAD